MMTSKKTTVKLSDSTLTELDNRSDETPMAHIIDRDLTRYYGLLAEEREKLDIKSSDLKKLSSALSSALVGNSRMTNIPILRSIVDELGKQGALDKSLTEKIKGMPTSTFLALIDLAEGC